MGQRRRFVAYKPGNRPGAYVELGTVAAHNWQEAQALAEVLFNEAEHIPGFVSLSIGPEGAFDGNTENL